MTRGGRKWATGARREELESTVDLDGLALACVGKKVQVQIGRIVQCVDTERCGISDIGEKKYLPSKLVGMPVSSNDMFPEMAFLKRSPHHSQLILLSIGFTFRQRSFTRYFSCVCTCLPLAGHSLKWAVELTYQAYWRMHLSASCYGASYATLFITILEAGPGQFTVSWKLP